LLFPSNVNEHGGLVQEVAPALRWTGVAGDRQLGFVVVGAVPSLQMKFGVAGLMVTDFEAFAVTVSRLMRK
jgi:hypothetical protein